MLIVEDTQEYGSVVGSSNAQYINSLASTYRSATQWFGVQHPGSSDYLDLLAGSTAGGSATTVVDELHAKGISWHAYIEGMPSACYSGTSTANGLYDTTHNPFRSFANYNASQPGGWCSGANLGTEGALPYPASPGVVSTLGGSTPPAFVWITPNDCDNMLGDSRSGSPCRGSSAAKLIQAGDAWLSTNLAPVLTSSWFAQNGVVIITWSQGTSNLGCCSTSVGGHVPTVVITSLNKGMGAFTSTGDHYGTLAAIENAYGVGLLGHSADLTNGALPLLHGDLGAAFGTPQTPGAISGTVTDSVTSQPVAGATVSDGAGSTPTDATGKYTLTNVVPGTYTITTSASGYTTQSATAVGVSPGATTTENVALVPQPGSITGTVTDVVTGQPVAGATVSYAGPKSTTGSATTATNGTYSFTSLPEGGYSVSASANGYVSWTGSAVVTPGSTTPEPIALTPQSGGISGRVTSSAGSKGPLAGAVVSYSGPSGTGSTTTAADGTYSLTNLVEGGYQVTASATNFAPLTATVPVPAGATAAQSFALAPGSSSITGTVTDSATGTPIAGAVVACSGGSATTNGSGVYTLSSLAPATYSLTVSAGGYATSPAASVTTTAGNSATKNFALTAQPGGVSGTVTDNSTNSPIAGATVTYSEAGGQVPMVVISSAAAGKGPIATPGNHFGTLRAIEQALNLPPAQRGQQHRQR